MKKAYVTGATGCVGGNLVNELTKAGWEVIVLHRKSSDLSRLAEFKVRFQEADFYDLDSVRSALAEKADALFHVAGNTSHWSTKETNQKQWKDNVLATRNLARAALEKGIGRFIFTSTGATLQYQHYDEELCKKISVPYIRTKRLAELEVYKCIEEGLDAVILQPIIVVGAYDYNSYSQIFQVIKQGLVKVAFPGRLSFCHAADVAIGHIQAYEKGRKCERYVLSGEYTSWLDFFQRIGRQMNVTPPKYAAPTCLLRIAASILQTVSFFTGKEPLVTHELITLIEDFPDFSYYERRKASEELGYKSRPLDVMVQDCYDWMVKTGRI